MVHSKTNIFREGQNCWVISSAEKGTFLIDGSDYFADIHATFQQAEKEIFIVGWDLSSKIVLTQGNSKQTPSELGSFLETLVKRKSDLQVYLLVWDYSAFVSGDRDPMTRVQLGLFSHPRIHLVMDSHHPMGASHHQKIVVVDNSLAYCGGLDLTQGRWDTSHHEKKSKSRFDHNNKPYRPFHDIQMKVSGEAAQRLGELVRDRWNRATGDNLEPLASGERANEFKWDRVDFEHADVAIARTEPLFKENPRINEIEKSYVDMIRSAQKKIYIENQYLTADRVVVALMESLKKPDGPEVIIFLPAKSTGWVEGQTLWAKRDQIIFRLKEADKFGRLGIFSPATSDTHEAIIKVHAKVMIIDSQYARVGSANISNRSMGLDTECDLILMATENKPLESVIDDFQNRLLADHLGMTKEDVSKIRIEKGSILPLVQSRIESGKVVPLDPRQGTSKMISETVDLVDLKHPLEFEELTDQLVYHTRPKKSFFKSKLFLSGCFGGGVLLLSSLWVWTPLNGVLNIEFFRDVFVWFHEQPFSYGWILLIYFLSAMLFIPINLLILTTASLYDVPVTLSLIFSGSLINATFGYAVGYMIGKNWINKFFKGRVKRLTEKLSQKGLLPILLIRIVPIAPFATINLICGAARYRFRSYLLGTFLGLLPGALTLTFFQKSLLAVIRDANPLSIGTFVGAVILLVSSGFYIKRRFGSRK